jgi:nitrous oxide reductase
MLSLKIGDKFKVKFDDVVDAVEVIAIGEYDGGGTEYLEVLVNDDFYAELYIEDMGRDWSIVE